MCDDFVAQLRHASLRYSSSTAVVYTRERYFVHSSLAAFQHAPGAMAKRVARLPAAYLGSWCFGHVARRCPTILSSDLIGFW